MKKLALGVFALALAFSVTVASADASILSNLTVGSRGADVSTLQTALISGGYLTAVSAPTGYFGSATKAALAKWQSAKGISPAVGYFGPLSRAAFNGSAMTTGTTTGSTVTTGTTVSDGTDGSITASQSSYVSSGIQLKKGDTKNILAIKLKATSGAVSVTRADVHFNLRPWLVFNQLTLKDQNGNVLATKNLSSASDATEITVGSDYLVRFDNVNFKVTPGSDIDLVVGATVLNATDKITNGQIVNVTFGSNGLRTQNGIGYTDSVGGTDLNGSVSGTGIAQQTGTGVNSFTLSSTGSVADIYARISPSSPVTHQQVVSLTQTTSNVLLGVVSLKSANNSSTLNTLTVGIGGSVGTSTALSNIRLFNGSQSYGGTWSGNNIVFSNLSLPLAQDNWQDYSIEADVAASSTGTAYITLNASPTTIVGTDANYNTPTVEGNTVTTNVVTLTTNAIAVQNASAVTGGAITQSNSTVGYNVTYKFDLVNTSNNDLYVSATSTTFVTTTGNASSSLSTIQTVSNNPTAGDVAGVAYIIPAGSTRTFTLVGAIRGTTGNTVTLKATQVNYGVGSANPAALSITTGLENLSQTASF